ncbi:MAG: molecular chaperone [Rhodomicrobiaceae bacterium]
MIINMRHLLTIAGVTFFLAILQSKSSFAMSVEPMVIDMSTTGKLARESFAVSNNGTKPLPVEISVSRLELGVNGEQKTQSAGDEFLIYPAQAMIPAGGSQVFRVQWIGEPYIPKSQAYSFSVSQIPVALPKGTSGIQVLMNFGVIVNVAPPKGQAAILVESAAPVAGKDGKRLASLTVKNPGNKHAYLKQSTIRLSGGGWSAEMTPGEIAQKVGLGIVQPGHERRFVLPVEVPSGVTQIKADVQFRPDER